MQIKEIISAEESVSESQEKPFQDEQFVDDPENPYFRPIVRTSDTTVLEFLSFVNMMGLVKCPDIVKIVPGENQ